MGADLGDTTPKGQSLGSTLRLLTREPVPLTAVLSLPAQGVASRRNYLSWSEVRDQRPAAILENWGGPKVFLCQETVLPFQKRKHNFCGEERHQICGQAALQARGAAAS